MPKPIGWAAKFGPDPDHPGYAKVIGAYAPDFLAWAKQFGQPTWHPRGDQCVLSRPNYALGFQLYWPLAVLEPLYNRMRENNPVCIINPRNREPILRSAI